jgi:hypothetical protein
VRFQSAAQSELPYNSNQVKFTFRPLLENLENIEFSYQLEGFMKSGVCGQTTP